MVKRTHQNLEVLAHTEAAGMAMQIFPVCVPKSIPGCG
jgi:hypothetical protein